METIFIREINHLKTISDFKYKHNWLILTHKKLTIRLSCFCSTATVEDRHFKRRTPREQRYTDGETARWPDSPTARRHVGVVKVFCFHYSSIYILVFSFKRKGNQESKKQIQAQTCRRVTKATKKVVEK